MAFDVAGAKRTFFDRKAVADKIPAATKKALSLFGLGTRQVAKKSLKYGDKPSKPGMPPTVHRSKKFTWKKTAKGVTTMQASSPLRELIFFGFDAAAQSVVIGPAIGGSKSGAPHALEYGGVAMLVSRGKRKTIRIAPRPFMQPAFEKQLTKAAGNYKNLVSR